MGLFSGGVFDTAVRIGTLGLSDKAGLTGNKAANAAPLAYQADQSELIKRLQARASGQAPSLAEAQTNQNLNKVFANQVSALNSDNGLNPAQRAMLAGQAGQQAQTDIAQQGTIAKIAEQDSADQMLGNQILGAQGTAMNQNKMDMDAQNTQANRWTQAISGAGQAAASVATKSDRNAKENISDSDGAGRDFIDHIKGKLYEYKDSSDGQGVHLGVMAQDLEKDPIGKSMVFEEGGAKKIDFGKGFGAVLAAMTEINDKLKEIETKKGK